MKKYLILYKLLFIGLGGYGQLNIGSGTQWITNGNTTVVLQNMDLVNNGSISASAGSFKFTGTQNSTINGSNMPLFNILEISKTNKNGYKTVAYSSMIPELVEAIKEQQQQIDELKKMVEQLVKK